MLVYPIEVAVTFFIIISETDAENVEVRKLEIASVGILNNDATKKIIANAGIIEIMK